MVYYIKIYQFDEIETSYEHDNYTEAMPTNWGKLG